MKTKRGRKTRGTTERVDVRLTPEEAVALNAWRAAHALEGWDGEDRAQSRNEAIRVAVRRLCGLPLRGQRDRLP